MSRKEKIEKHAGGAQPGGVVTGGVVHAGGTITGRCACGGSYVFVTDDLGRSAERCTHCGTSQSLGFVPPGSH
jgi:hypothetical protein